VKQHRFQLKDLPEAAEGAALIALAVIASPLLKRWYRGWGATTAEKGATLPGDELVPYPRMASTRAVAIAADAARVWPFLLQLGMNRGGWYSYELLEAAVGIGGFVEGRTSERVVPELQTLSVGDEVWMHRMVMPLTVRAMEREKALVFLTRTDLADKRYFELGERMPKAYVNSSWAFYLKPAHPGMRLLVRSRMDYSPSFFNDVAWRVFADPISFVMERKMLLNIRRIVEGRGVEGGRAERAPDA